MKRLFFLIVKQGGVLKNVLLVFIFLQILVLLLLMLLQLLDAYHNSDIDLNVLRK